jgi:hypothetical protein
MDLCRSTWEHITTDELSTCFVIPPRCVRVNVLVASKAEVQGFVMFHLSTHFALLRHKASDHENTSP